MSPRPPSLPVTAVRAMLDTRRYLYRGEQGQRRIGALFMVGCLNRCYSWSRAGMQMGGAHGYGFPVWWEGARRKGRARPT